MQERNDTLLVALIDILASLDSKKKLKNLLYAKNDDGAEIQGGF